jgi:nicotinamide-nucleotide amidase
VCWSTIYEQSTARLGHDSITEAGAENLMATAKAIAADLQKSSGANYVLVQLYAGDNDTLNNKDKSIVIYNTLLTGDSFHQATHSIAGPIKRKQNQAALMALDLLRRYLQDKSISY